MCKISRLDSNQYNCNKTMCGACMSLWISTSKRNRDQPSYEEKALAKSNADNDAVVRKNTGP